MQARWEVDDGYVGKSGSQYTDIPDEELEGLTETEQEELIREYIQDDFDSRVSWHILGYED